MFNILPRTNQDNSLINLALLHHLNYYKNTSEIIYVFSQIKNLSPIKQAAGQNQMLPCVWRIKKQNVANKVQSPLQLRTPA